jgi:uncharacterized protein (TIGR03492 family)
VQRLLVISNGIGEDSIGAEIVRRLPRSIVAEAYPTLGDGQAYRGVCPIVGPRARLASEGSRVNKGTLRKDIAAGGLRTIPPALRFLRAQRTAYDSFLVVGDFIGVAACWLSGIRGIVYLDVYNTGYGRRYYLGEKLVMRRVCRTVFCRSPILSDQLKPLGIDARAAGNVMMDAMAAGDYDAARRRLRLKAVTLLPGSRAATVGNFALQIDALALLPEGSRPDIFVAVADGVGPNDLAQAANLFLHVPQGREQSDLGRLSGRGLHVHLARGALKPLVEASDLVLSQAGTATVQALGLGRPVITFARETDRMQRFTDENRLFGEARIIVPAQAPRIAAEVERLLGDQAERKRLGELAKTRIGGPGVIDSIIAAIAAAGSPAPAGVTTST